jgi:anti-sigma B factor antagonist
MANFSLSSKSEHEGIAVIMPKGYINDIGASSLERMSEKFLDNGLKKLIVNFADVQFINTIGLSIFLSIVQRTLEFESSICFTNMKKDHREIFEMAGLMKYVKVFKDELDAFNYLIGRKS